MLWLAVAVMQSDYLMFQSTVADNTDSIGSSCNTEVVVFRVWLMCSFRDSIKYAQCGEAMIHLFHVLAATLGTSSSKHVNMDFTQDKLGQRSSCRASYL